MCIFACISVKRDCREIGLQVNNVPMDGNCLFSSLADQLERTDQYPSGPSADSVRQSVVHYLYFMANDPQKVRGAIFLRS